MLIRLVHYLICDPDPAVKRQQHRTLHMPFDLSKTHFLFLFPPLQLKPLFPTVFCTTRQIIHKKKRRCSSGVDLIFWRLNKSSFVHGSILLIHTIKGVSLPKMKSFACKRTHRVWILGCQEQLFELSCAFCKNQTVLRFGPCMRLTSLELVRACWDRDVLHTDQSFTGPQGEMMIIAAFF